MPHQNTSIGVLSPLGMGPYFGGIIGGVREAATAAGYTTVTLQSVPAGVDETVHWDSEAHVRPVGWSRFAGFISIVSAVNHACLRDILDAGKPLVLISQDAGDLAVPVVVPDNTVGVRTSVTHLIEHGHRRIAFAGNRVELDIAERYEAYVDTLRAHGIEADPALFFETGDKGAPGGARAAAAMLSAGLPSTAVVASTDLNAIGLMTAFSAAGLELPRQQAIVGFDDGEHARNASPSLSTVAQDVAEIGKTAARLVLAHLDGEAPRPGHHHVPNRFIARQSCGCAGAHALTGPANADPAAAIATESELPIVVRPLARVVASLGDERTPAWRASLARFAAAFVAATESDTEPVAWELRAATDALWQAVRPMELRQLTTLLRDGARQWAPDERRVPDVLLEVSVALGAASTRAQFDVTESLQRSLATQYDVGMDLLGDDENATSLRWLGRTTAVAGMLAVRDPDPAKPTLTIEGAYARDGALQAPATTTIDEREFPPPELLAQARAHPDTAILVISIQGDGREQALLAIVAPVDHHAATGQETFHQWAALLGAAFERRRLVKSLQHRQTELAESLGRERRLARDVGRSEQRYALAAAAANDGLWDWDCRAETMFYSDRALTLLGIEGSPSGIAGWLDRVHDSERPGLEKMIDRQRGGTCEPLEYEHRVTTDAGETRWILCRALAVKTDDTVTRIVGSFTDVTARHTLEEQLRHQALYDGLTSLPNRVLLIDRLDVSIQEHKRYRRRRFALLFIDLDGFKAVNDTLGHAMGDRLLVAVATRLQQFVRSADTAARLGGDEFIVLLQELAADVNVESIVARLREDLATPFDIEGHRIAVTASIGVAISDHGYETAEEMLRDADIAMYQAKTARTPTGPGH